MNKEFPIVRRYAFVLKAVFVCFTYGFAIPTLFVVVSLALLIQFIIDKLFITYYYKEGALHNDVLNRLAVKIIKYGVVVFLYFGGLQIAMNTCTTHN